MYDPVMRYLFPFTPFQQKKNPQKITTKKKDNSYVKMVYVVYACV